MTETTLPDRSLIDAITTARSRAGLPIDQFARVLGTDRATLYGWLQGETIPDPDERLRVLQATHLIDETFKLVGEAELVAAAVLYDRERALDAFRRGDLIEAREALMTAAQAGENALRAGRGELTETQRQELAA